MVDLFSRQIAEESSALLPMTGADCVRLEVNIRSARASTLNDQRAIEELLAQDRSPPVYSCSAVAVGHAISA